MKIRLSCCFDCTVSVPDGLTDAVALQEAKDAVDHVLPYRMDNQEFLGNEITGVNSFSAEEL
jgi:hypothetical protein